MEIYFVIFVILYLQGTEKNISEKAYKTMITRNFNNKPVYTDNKVRHTVTDIGYTFGKLYLHGHMLNIS